MSTPAHRGPSLLAVAIVFASLFVASLAASAALAAGAHFPSPFDPAPAVTSYFSDHPAAVRASAFLQLGAAIPLAVFTATASSRLRYLGVQAAGPVIALVGGVLAAGFMALSGLSQWILAQHGVAGETLRAFHLLAFAAGGPGVVVPFGLLVAGISVSGGLMNVLPRWVMWLGLVIAELASLSLVIPGAMYLLPLARFPGFVWMIAVGVTLAKTRKKKELTS